VFDPESFERIASNVVDERVPTTLKDSLQRDNQTVGVSHLTWSDAELNKTFK